MDRELKGLISDLIDKANEQKNITDRASWAIEALKTEYKIKPHAQKLLMPTEVLEKMLASTYALGSIMSTILDEIVNERLSQKRDELIYNKWVKEFGREEADKKLAEDIVRSSKVKSKSIKIEVTDEDCIYIREKLASIIPQLKVKIEQEWALKKAKESDN